MAKGKKSKKKLIIFGSLGLLVLILIILVLTAGGKEEIIAVQTEKVEKRTITQSVSATGKINPEFKVVITPEVTGEIVTLPVKEGDSVKKGQLLIKIKADAYVAQKQRAEANLLSAKASLSQRKAELDKVTSDRARIKELHSKGLASQAELEAIESNYLSVKAMHESAQANVMQSEAALRETIEQLNKTTIYSPMDGTVSQLNVELGERVLGSGFSQGTNIMTISDLNNMEATVDVDENDVVLISVGDTTRIKVDAFGDRSFDGVVTQIGNSAKSSGFGTQEQVVNFEVRIKLLDPDFKLRPGMSCTASIETETKQNVIAVPMQSVTAREDVDFGKEEENSKVKIEKKNGNKIQEVVFIVDGSSANMKPVKTGISDNNYIEVKEGIDEGVEIISGSYRAISRELKDGSKIRIENKNGNTNK